MVSAINSSAVLLSWEASSSTVSGFTVTYTSLQAGSSGVLSLNGSVRSVVITSLSPGQEYQFTVAITGESPSASVSITLPPAGMYAGREGRENNFIRESISRGAVWCKFQLPIASTSLFSEECKQNRSKRLTIVHAFRPESENFDFIKTGYQRKGHLKRSIMAQI